MGRRLWSDSKSGFTETKSPDLDLRESQKCLLGGVMFLTKPLSSSILQPQSVNRTTGRHMESYPTGCIVHLKFSINNNVVTMKNSILLIAIPYLSAEQPVGISVSCHKHR